MHEKRIEERLQRRYNCTLRTINFPFINIMNMVTYFNILSQFISGMGAIHTKTAALSTTPITCDQT